jgi:hypothetical protein
MRRFLPDPRGNPWWYSENEARKISAEGKNLAKKGQRHIAPDMMRLQIDSSLIA